MNGTSDIISSDMPALNTKTASCADSSSLHLCNGSTKNSLDNNHANGLNSEPLKNGSHADSVKLNVRTRGSSVRSSSDGAVEAMEGSKEDHTNMLYRTVSESDKHERARRNEELLKDGMLDSETDTEGPDSPVEVGAVLQLNGNDVVATPDGTIASSDLYTFHSEDSPGIVCELNNGNQPLAPKQRAVSVAEVKEMAYARLQEELQKAQQELKLKDEEVEKLSRIREEVSSELEELTASLFQEAHNMVREANIKQAAAQKHLKEANLKIEVLQAEVQALKTLVITSTPSMPNPKLHPQIDSKSKGRRLHGTGRNILNSHRRSPSNYELRYKEDTPPESPERETPVLYCSEPNPENEVDPLCHKEFIAWKESPELDKSSAFLSRIYDEDILLCMRFPNAELAEEVLKSVENNTLIIEAVSGKNPFPKKCLLLDTPRLCKYKMKLGNSDKWYHISQLCRNRIAAVCELLCYLRYIKQGLVRSPVNDVYWEIMRRRKEITFARLGLNSTT